MKSRKTALLACLAALVAVGCRSSDPLVSYGRMKVSPDKALNVQPVLVDMHPEVPLKPKG